MSLSYFPPLGADLAPHLAAQQCASQWRGFLASLAQEFASALSEPDLQALMARVGTRFALQHPLGPCATLDELQSSINAVWQPIDWGSALLVQQADHLEIEHRLSPLTAAMGAEHVQWSGGFLQGAYQAWLSQAGAGTLAVAQSAPLDGWGTLHLRLAH